MATFGSLAVDSVGTGYTLTASATGPSSGVSSAFTITVGTASQLVFTTQPAGTTAGGAIGAVVTARDNQGNRATGFGGSVAVAITSGTGTANAHLIGTASVTASSGVATFSGLSIDSVGTGYTLTASASGTSNGVSGGFAITAGAATQIALNAGNNQSATVNTAVTTAPSVIVRDQFGNVVPGVSVTFAVASGGGSLTGGSATTGSNGIATVGSWTLGQTAGANTLTATSTGLTGSPVTFTADRHRRCRDPGRAERGATASRRR